MALPGTSLTSRDVRLESAKRANADIDQIAVAKLWSIGDTRAFKLALLWQIFAADERDGIPKSVFQ
jgi:hypothetical protein